MLVAPNFFRRYTAEVTCTKTNSKIITFAIIPDASLTIVFTGGRFEKSPRDIFSCRKLQISNRNSGSKIQFHVPSCNICMYTYFN